VVEELEARYQRAVFNGREDVLAEDFKLRYGDKWAYYLEISRNAGEDDIKRAEERADELAKLVENRIDDVELASAYAKYCRDLPSELQLELGLDLLGYPNRLREVLKWGLALHYADDVIGSPPYLAKLLIRLMDLADRPRRSALEEVEDIIYDRALLALIEGHLAGDFDVDIYVEIYGQIPQRRIRAGNLAYFDPRIGIVVNPAYAVEEVMDALMQAKSNVAMHMAKTLGLHGEYEFDRNIRCGVLYLSDGSKEGSGMVLFCPWFSPPRYLNKFKKINKIFIIWGKKPINFKPKNDAYIFMTEDEIQAIRPIKQNKLYNYIIDLLYRYNFYLEEF